MDVRALGRKLRVRGGDALARRLGIDARALAALRISLGLLLLADLLVRSFDLVAFYTDAGALPRTALREQYGGLHYLSLHAVSGEAWVQVLLFLAAAAAALALVVGYRTTTVTVVSWLLLVSLHARNPVLLNGGDSLLRRFLFWGIFLPLGERWSVDALRADRRPREWIASVASAALLLQVVVVYLANALFKLQGNAWTNGDAILYVFSLDQLTVLLGDVLAQYPDLLHVLGRLWFVLLLSSVLLVALTGRARALLVALFVAVHLGMALTLRLGLFPLISIAGLLPFLPPTVWDAATRAVGSRRDRVARWGDRLDRTLPAPSAGVRVPPVVARWGSRAATAVVAVLLVTVLVWNAASLGYVDAVDGEALPADPDEHRWDMFAPSPPRADGWYVVPGRLESGRQVDAFHRSPVSWDRPPEVASTYPSHRWFVYLNDLRRAPYADLRPHFAEYLCQRWNDRHEDRLTELTVYYVEQPTRFDGTEPTRRVELHEHQCSPGG